MNENLYNNESTENTKKNININVKLILIIMGIIMAVALFTVFALNSVPNKAISYEEQITTAQSEIKIQEKRRADLIPNLVDCVKEYDKHEYETLMAVVEARGTNSDSSVQEIQTMISVVAEQYPDLKSNENYKELMNELSTTENKIAQVRSNYNEWVTKYNSYVKKFPNRQVIDFLGYEVTEYQKLTFDVSSDAPADLFN
jgi:LemA protein